MRETVVMLIVPAGILKKARIPNSMYNAPAITRMVLLFFCHIGRKLPYGGVICPGGKSCRRREHGHGCQLTGKLQLAGDEMSIERILLLDGAQECADVGGS